MPSRGLLETYLNMCSHARDHSSTKHKSHINPCIDDGATGVTVRQTDGWTDAISALYIR